MAIKQPLVLLVDDEHDLCILMQMTLSKLGIKSHIAHHLQQAKHFFTEYKYDACITDLNLPDGTGVELVKHVNQNYSNTPIAVLTAYGNMEIAIAALKAGAFDFVSKPIEQQHLQKLLMKALHVPESNQNEQNFQIEDQMLIGESPAILCLKESVRKIARSQAPVFISGESGSGKEVVAHLIHQLSNRRDSPFIAINCGAISEDNMENELFGYVKGSFAGAKTDKKGLIQAADGGCLFLDEIAELSLAMQAKLLRTVQEKKIRPIGSNQEIDVDFRIISATNQNLEQLIAQGKFRQDLFFRIHVMDVCLPPLRERGQDILILANHFLQKICREWDIPAKQLSEPSKDYLLKQSFIGNVRELQNRIERAITLCEESKIEISHLESPVLNSIASSPNPEFNDRQLQPSKTGEAETSLPEEGLEQYLEKVEKETLLNALNQTHWNRTLAAKKLGMTFRSLRYRLKKFGLDTDDD